MKNDSACVVAVVVVVVVVVVVDPSIVTSLVSSSVSGVDFGRTLGKVFFMPFLENFEIFKVGRRLKGELLEGGEVITISALLSVRSLFRGLTKLLLFSRFLFLCPKLKLNLALGAKSGLFVIVILFSSSGFSSESWPASGWRTSCRF